MLRLITLWAAWRHLRDPGPNLIITEGVHHIPKEILSLGLLSVETMAQGEEGMRKGKVTRFWFGGTAP